MANWTVSSPILMQILSYFKDKIEYAHDTKRREKTKDDTITPVRSEWCSRGFQIFSWGWSSGEFSNHACGVLIAI